MDHALLLQYPAQLWFKTRALDLEVGEPGNVPVTRHESEFIIGLYAPVTRPGTYDLYISVGKRDGTPAIAMPLEGDDGERRYLLGRIALEASNTAHQ